MNRNDIVDSLRAEITHLQKILEMMEQLPGSSTNGRGPGRPKGSATAAVKPDPAVGKRVMSAEGKARIAAAQKKRWAKVKRASTTSVPAEQPKAASNRQGDKAANKAVTPRPAKKNAAQPRKNAVKAPAEPGPKTE